MTTKACKDKCSMIGGIVMILASLLALVEAMGYMTILGANGLPWFYIVLILFGVHKLMCKDCGK